MRLRKQKLAPYIVLLFAVLLVLPAMSGFRVRTAGAIMQDNSRSDFPQTVKTSKGARIAVPRSASAPANDDCQNAVAVTGADCPFTDAVSTMGATDEAGEPQSTCSLQGNSVWYNFTTTAAGGAEVTVATCNSDFDTALMVWQPVGAMCDFGNFTPIACNDDAASCGNGSQSRVSFNAEPGVTYKIQAGGFSGETGNLTIDIDCVELQCLPIVINGVLGSGSAAPPDQVVNQFSGDQLGRLNRNGVSSTCAMSKFCDIFIAGGLRAFDAYEILNESSDPQCVTVNLDSNDVCNLQSNAYLMSYDPNSICTNYLADPGLSTGTPPAATNMSFIVPGGATLIIVVHTVNPGETGCTYTVTVGGNLCQPFDCCIQSDDGNRILQFNSETGDYRFQDCSKGITLEGTGEVDRHLCMITLNDRGPDPNNPDRFVMAHVSKGEDPHHACTFIGDANVRTTAKGKLVHIHDSDVRDSTCVCPGP